jgi:hypothetical protein
VQPIPTLAGRTKSSTARRGIASGEVVFIPDDTMEALDAEQQQQLQQQEWPEGASSSCRYAPTLPQPPPRSVEQQLSRTAVARENTACHGDARRPACAAAAPLG